MSAAISARQAGPGQGRASQGRELELGHYHLSSATDVELTDRLMEMQMMSLSYNDAWANWKS